MKMMRRYFISSDLDDLERFEEALERQSIPKEQIHVLSLDDTSVGNHRNLNEVAAFMKKDLVHSGWYGLALGLAVSLLVLALAYFAGWTQTQAGWMPFVFLAIVLLGFFTWEGGLWGIQTPNMQFKRFEQELKAGRHVIFVDTSPAQEGVVSAVVKNHTSLLAAGVGTAAPGWWSVSNRRIKHFLVDTMP